MRVVYLVTYRFRNSTASKEFHDIIQAKLFSYNHHGVIYKLTYENDKFIDCKML